MLGRMGSKPRLGGGGRHVSFINSVVLNLVWRVPGVLKITRKPWERRRRGALEILYVSFPLAKTESLWNCVLLPRSGVGRRSGKLAASIKPINFNSRGTQTSWVPACSFVLKCIVTSSLTNFLPYFHYPWGTQTSWVPACSCLLSKLAISFPLNVLSLTGIRLLWARQESRRGRPLTQVSLVTGT